MNAFTEDRFHTILISASQRAEAAQGMTHVNDYLKEHTQDILGGVTSIVSGIFSIFTIGLFAIFLTKDGPEVRRVLLSLLTPERQQRVLFAWETAIRKVGGYLYSRLLLALINGGLMFTTLKIVRAPFALPLALFEGLVAAFIRVIGTYVGGVLPVIVVLAERGRSAAVVVVAELLLYQLVENYYMSPRISARTIELNAGVAFGAAMARRAVGGFLGAFFALPIAATVQRFLSEYSKTHDVADSASMRIDEPPENRPSGSHPVHAGGFGARRSKQSQRKFGLIPNPRSILSEPDMSVIPEGDSSEIQSIGFGAPMRSAQLLRLAVCGSSSTRPTVICGRRLRRESS